MAGIRINEIPRESTLDGRTDLVHVYKRIGDRYKSFSAPLSAVAFQGPAGNDGLSGTNGIDGTDGDTIAQLFCYRRLPSTATTQEINNTRPGLGTNDGGSFNFDTRQFIAPRDWYGEIPPIFPGEESYILYSCFGVAKVTGKTGIDTNIVWSNPKASGVQGLPGSDGVSTYQAVIFTRSESQPGAPKGGSFNFGTDTLLPPTSATDSVRNPDNDNTHDWYVDVGGDLGPRGDKQLWMCNHQFAADGDTGIDTADIWSTPTRFATDGANGYSTYFGSIFKRTNSDISGERPGEGDITQGGYYDFRANQFVFSPALTGAGGPMEGWSEEVPPEEVLGQRVALWQSTTIATSNGSFLGSDPVRDTSLIWSEPVKVHQPAVDGNQGNAVTQVRAYLRSIGATPPPIGTLSAAVFNFEDKILDLSNTDWSSQPFKSSLPDNDPNYGEDFLYVSVGIASSIYDAETNSYPNDTDINWADPLLSSEIGDSAVSTFLGQVYTRYAGDLDIQQASYRPEGGGVTFTPTGATLTPPSVDPSGTGLVWTPSIPVGQGQIYVSQRNFAVIGSSGTDNWNPSNPWSTPAVLAYDGTAGDDGITNSLITLYYGSDEELTGSNIPTFPSNISLTVDLNISSNNFGKPTKSTTHGNDAVITNKQVLSSNSAGDATQGTGWYTQLPANDWVYAIEAMAADSDASDSVVTDVIAGTEWSDTVLFRRPGSNGLAGLGTAVVNLYKRTSTGETPDPSNPTGDIKYYLGSEGSFSRGEIDLPAGSNLQGWSLTPPSYTGSNHYLWQITATASSRENYDLISDVEWTSPIIFAQNPFDLTETTVSHIVQAYIRSSVVPTTNPGTVTVDLSGELAGQITSGVENGWSTSIPDGDQQVYIVHATASGPVSNINDTDTIASNEWTEPAKWGIVGERGLQGLPGAISRPLTLFKRTDLTPVAGELDLPSLSGTYDFISDSWAFGTYLSNGSEGATNGWSFELPAKDITDRVLWQTFATAISTHDSSSYVVLSDDWSLPRATSQDGAVTPIYSTVENPTTVAQCSLTQTNSDFAFISFYNYPITDISSLTDNVIEDLVFIKMLGQDGTSINIKDSLDSVDNLPSSNNSPGDSYLISGDLYVYNGTEFVDAGTIQGPSGLPGQPGADGSSSYLHIAYADDEFGTNFTTDNTPGDRSFLGTYTDSTELDSTDHDDYTWVKIVGKDGSAGRPNGCEAVYGYDNSEGPSSITYLEDENVLQLKGEVDTNIGMVYPAFDVSDGRKLRFTVTYKTPDAPASSGIYIRLYESTTDLAEGKDRVGNRSGGDNHNSPLIQQFNRQHISNGNDTSFIKITPSGSDLENGPVPGEYTTRTIEYTPRSDSRYVSLTILNWSGMGKKRLWVKPIRTTIVGDTGEPGEHGITSKLVEIFKKVPITEAVPSAPSGNTIFSISDTTISGLSDGWSTAAPDAASGSKIYRATALVTYSADQISGTITISGNNWSEVKAWSVNANRTAPVVTRIATYEYFNSYYVDVQNDTVPTSNNYSFRQSSGSGQVLDGFSDSVTTSTYKISDIGQILFTTRGKDNIDYTDFWKGLDTTSEFIWKYGSSWIIFKRTAPVDVLGSHTGVRVEVLDHSDDISQVKDLPGFHMEANKISAEVIFGYTPNLQSQTIFLYKRSASPTISSNAASPTSELSYNFNTDIVNGSLNGWSRTPTSSDGINKYLHRIQATATARLNTDLGVYVDTIPITEWSDPIIITQDGLDGREGNTYFQKFLYTRTQNSNPLLVSQWSTDTAGNYRPGVVNVNTKVYAGNEIGRIAGNSQGNLTSRQGVVWSEDIPSESNGQFLWVIVAPVSNTSQSQTVQVTSNQWSEPVLLSKDGVGLNSATVRLYKRTDGSTPSTGVPGNRLGFTSLIPGRPSAKPPFTYNFSTGNLNTNNVGLNGWSTGLPEAGGNTVWVSRAVASSTGTTDSIGWNQWQVPEKLVSDGTSLVFIGSFVNRNNYISHINHEDNGYNGIPPRNSYHIETLADGRNVSYLYIGGENLTDKNNGSNFVQLTIDGVNGQDGAPGTSFIFKGAIASLAAAPTTTQGHVYRITGGDDAGKVYVRQDNAWKLLTLDGSDGQDSTVAGPNGNSVFICYSPNPITNKPTKPSKTSNGNVGSTWYTSSIPPTGKTYHWMSQKVARSATQNIAWGEPIQISGEAGEPGFQTITLTIYKRSETAPQRPASGNTSGYGAYDFTGKKLLVPDGWSSTIQNAGEDADDDAPQPSDPKNSIGYEWTASNTNKSKPDRWTVAKRNNLDNLAFPLWSSTAVASIQITDGGSNVDTGLSWSSPLLEKLNGRDLIDGSVDVDVINGSVKNGGGVAKIVATDRQDPPQLLTQAAYNALANPSSTLRSQYGWRSSLDEGGIDTVQEDTLYLIF